MRQEVVSEYIHRARRHPTQEDANPNKNRKSTHPRKRREGWGTRQIKTAQNLARPEDLLTLQSVAHPADFLSDRALAGLWI
jgi:hypothetical protein